MFLKKINKLLEKTINELNYEAPLEVQEETFSSIKSGADCLIVAPKQSGKTSTLIFNVIQRLDIPSELSPRALIMVENKAKVLEMKEQFALYNKHNKLRIYGVYEQTDLDNDKNQISLGIDVLIGTPKKLAEMFSSAGYDVNRLKMFIIDGLDILLKNREDQIIARLSESIGKTQRVFFAEEFTEKIDFFIDRVMIEPLIFEFEDEIE